MTTSDDRAAIIKLFCGLPRKKQQEILHRMRRDLLKVHEGGADVRPSGQTPTERPALRVLRFEHPGLGRSEGVTHGRKS